MYRLRTTRTSHGSRWHLLHQTLAGLALLTLALVTPAGADPGAGRAPDLGDCQKLQAPVGSIVALQVFGVGVQIYRWDGTTWTGPVPEAVLYADAGDHGVVGIHFGGPTWESVSGSRVVGTVIDKCTPDPTAIPWVLLGVASQDGPGIFDQVTSIQRLNTVGGIAPTTPGAVIGQEARVPYTADYVFYRFPH
jgi:hypothetical protein